MKDIQINKNRVQRITDFIFNQFDESVGIKLPGLTQYLSNQNDKETLYLSLGLLSQHSRFLYYCLVKLSKHDETKIQSKNENYYVDLSKLKRILSLSDKEFVNDIAQSLHNVGFISTYKNKGILVSKQLVDYINTSNFEVGFCSLPPPDSLIDLISKEMKRNMIKILPFF